MSEPRWDWRDALSYGLIGVVLGVLFEIAMRAS